MAKKENKEVLVQQDRKEPRATQGRREIQESKESLEDRVNPAILERQDVQEALVPQEQMVEQDLRETKEKRAQWVVQETQAFRVPREGTVDPETVVLVVSQGILD